MVYVVGRQEARAVVRLFGRLVQCHVAETPEEQTEGLARYASLEDGEGLLFRFDPPRAVEFVSGGARFPFDLVLLDGAGRVARLVEDIHPGQPGRWGAASVALAVEVPGGWCRRMRSSPAAEEDHGEGRVGTSTRRALDAPRGGVTDSSTRITTAQAKATIELFCYDGLRQGLSEHWRIAGSSYLGPARLVGWRRDPRDAGRIELDPESVGVVQGELWRVSGVLLDDLDFYYNPARRIRRRVRLDDGRRVEAYLERYQLVAGCAATVIGRWWSEDRPGTSGMPRRIARVPGGPIEQDDEGEWLPPDIETRPGPGEPGAGSDPDPRALDEAWTGPLRLLPAAVPSPERYQDRVVGPGKSLDTQKDWDAWPRMTLAPVDRPEELDARLPGGEPQPPTLPLGSGLPSFSNGEGGDRGPQEPATFRDDRVRDAALVLVAKRGAIFGGPPAMVEPIAALAVEAIVGFAKRDTAAQLEQFGGAEARRLQRFLRRLGRDYPRVQPRRGPLRRHVPVDLEGWKYAGRVREKAREPIEVVVRYAPEPNGFWNDADERLTLEVPAPTTPQALAEALAGTRRTIIHELAHLGQHLLARSAPGGLPAPAREHDVALEGAEPHDTRLREIYPLLQEEVDAFLESDQADAHAWVAQRPFFRQLAASDGDLWRRAVRQFALAVGQRRDAAHEAGGAEHTAGAINIEAETDAVLAPIIRNALAIQRMWSRGRANGDGRSGVLSGIAEALGGEHVGGYPVQAFGDILIEYRPTVGPGYVTDAGMTSRSLIERSLAMAQEGTGTVPEETRRRLAPLYEAMTTRDFRYYVTIGITERPNYVSPKAGWAGLVQQLRRAIGHELIHIEQHRRAEGRGSIATPVPPGGHKSYYAQPHEVGAIARNVALWLDRKGYDRVPPFGQLVNLLQSETGSDNAVNQILFYQDLFGNRAPGGTSQALPGEEARPEDEKILNKLYKDVAQQLAHIRAHDGRTAGREAAVATPPASVWDPAEAVTAVLEGGARRGFALRWAPDVVNGRQTEHAKLTPEILGSWVDALGELSPGAKRDLTGAMLSPGGLRTLADGLVAVGFATLAKPAPRGGLAVWRGIG